MTADFVRDSVDTFVARPTDVGETGDLRCSGLQVGGCPSNGHNECKTATPRGTIAAQEDLHRAFTSWTRTWTKAVCNSVSKLVKLDVQAAAGHTRIFALLARAFFQPLYSWWFLCAAEPRTDLAEPELVFPLRVFVLPKASRLCGHIEIGYDISSDELCTLVVSSGTLLADSDLQHTVVEGPGLLGMLVGGKLVLPLTVQAWPRCVNGGLRDLREVVEGSSGAKGRGRGRGRGDSGGKPTANVKAKFGSRGGRPGRL